MSVLLAWAGFFRDAVFGVVVLVVVLVVVSVLLREGWPGLARRTLGFLRQLRPVDALICWLLRREVRTFLRQVDPSSFSADARSKRVQIPEKGLSRDVLLRELEECKKAETDPHSGKIFAYVYTTDNDCFRVVEKAMEMFRDADPQATPTTSSSSEQESKRGIVEMFHNAFLHENALNPLVFPSLRKFEVEAVSMVADMLHGGAECVGNVTSGGTESILTAVKTYRDRARKLFPSITKPELVAPLTIHPAFLKAADYFGLSVKLVPLNSDLTPDLKAFEKAITPNTILLAASATEYCYGMVDPISQISKIAVEKGLPLHVDACIGGFMLPWVEKLGYPVPVFDFRLPGVMSMSADIHKYGLGAKGASVVVYRSPSIRRYQIFACSEWPGGLFGSPLMTGSRPGGTIAASWAVLRCMGQDGYTQVAERLMEVAGVMKEGINATEGLSVCGTPHMTIFSFRSCDPALNIFALADVMEKKGWKMERQQDTVHCTVLPSHSTESAHRFVRDLREATSTVKGDPSLSKKGMAGVYGMVGMVPDKSVVSDFLAEFFNEIYS